MKKTVSKVTVAGADFKALISAVTKFPTVGSFAASEQITFQVRDKKLQALAFGVVMSQASIPILEGEIPHLALDQRPVMGFSGVIQASQKVFIEAGASEVQIKAGKRSITIPRQVGAHHKLPDIDPAAAKIKVTATLAERVVYLSRIAFTDSSRPELCCVMLSGGQGMACNQKAIAVLGCTKTTGNTAIPLTLAKELTKGDTLIPCKNETFLLSGIATYVMPSPIRAQKDFPIKAINEMGVIQTHNWVKIRADKFSQLVMECDACLGSIAKTEVTLSVETATDGQSIQLSAKNGGAIFQGKLDVVAPKLSLKIPLEELVPLMGFIGAQEEFVELSAGVKNNETFLQFSSGWGLFPSR